MMNQLQKQQAKLQQQQAGNALPSCRVVRRQTFKPCCSHAQQSGDGQPQGAFGPPRRRGRAAAAGLGS
jgi:hypothetical protein